MTPERLAQIYARYEDARRVHPHGKFTGVWGFIGELLAEVERLEEEQRKQAMEGITQFGELQAMSEKLAAAEAEVERLNTRVEKQHLRLLGRGTFIEGLEESLADAEAELKAVKEENERLQKQVKRLTPRPAWDPERCVVCDGRGLRTCELDMSGFTCDACAGTGRVKP